MKKRWIAFLLALVLGTMPAIPASAAETQTTGTEEPATTEAAAAAAVPATPLRKLLRGISAMINTPSITCIFI